MNINIAGDFFISNNFLEKELFDSTVSTVFNEKDYNLVNLECPVTDNISENRIIKTGPHLCTDQRIFKQLKKLNINAVSLANNHILDYGQTGLLDTFSYCDANGIKYFGAGKNIVDAQRSIVFKDCDTKIALLNFCENEWSIATKYNGGANPLNIIDNFHQIQAARQIADFVIVVVHGGHEYFSLPSPRMIKQYRFIAESGADAVIGHHTHCYSGYEVFKNVPIVYSLGNMIFTMHSKFHSWYVGLIAQLKCVKGESVKLNLVPVCQDKDSYYVKLISGEAQEKVINDIENLSKIISSPDLMQIKWEEFVNRVDSAAQLYSIVNFFPERYFRSAMARLGFRKTLIKKKLLKSHLNYIRCEAHRDALLDSLSNKLKK